MEVVEQARLAQLKATQHEWLLDESGEIDTSAFEIEREFRGHNGPRCNLCGYCVCIWCEDEIEEECDGKQGERKEA